MVYQVETRLHEAKMKPGRLLQCSIKLDAGILSTIILPNTVTKTHHRNPENMFGSFVWLAAWMREALQSFNLCLTPLCNCNIHHVQSKLIFTAGQ